VTESGSRSLQAFDRFYIPDGIGLDSFDISVPEIYMRVQASYHVVNQIVLQLLIRCLGWVIAKGDTIQALLSVPRQTPWGRSIPVSKEAALLEPNWLQGFSQEKSKQNNPRQAVA
jgi:hypothetical protein